MVIKKYILLWSTLTLYVLTGCKPAPGQRNEPKQSVTAKVNVAAQSQQPVIDSDEQLFRQFLAQFKFAVKQKDKAALSNMLYYPLQTSPQWSNTDLQSSTGNYQDGLLSKKELPLYMADIFSGDVTRLVPASTEDDLSVIDAHSNEDYYLRLRQVTDKGTSLYELQKQYVQDNGKETSFGFVFGKVKGTYKILSYYTPWPLKG
ncbi:hypothetical protein [Mucilaginibacter sp. PAMB04168]|uniref:hypothetical protein n=1 Tax=Mucilaginibacter sp. PAMB04168 TaxID=3138567 RepID=UPI0031F61A89